MRIYPLADQRNPQPFILVLFPKRRARRGEGEVQGMALNWRTHAHRKVLIGCCPALHDAIYWLRVQYPVARDNIEQTSWAAETAD